MGHMLKAARHDAIVELLRDRPAMRTVDVARNLNVSMATARRDCIALEDKGIIERSWGCLLYTSPSPRDRTRSRMPSSA